MISKFVTALDEREFVQLLESCAHRIFMADRHSESAQIKAIAEQTSANIVVALMKLDIDEQRLVDRDQRVKAIMAYRARCNVSLGDAKAAIDNYVDNYRTYNSKE